MVGALSRVLGGGLQYIPPILTSRRPVGPLNCVEKQSREISGQVRHFGSTPLLLRAP